MDYKGLNKREILMYKENEKQYNGIDLLKFIMAIFVITIHTQPFINVKSVLFFNIYRIIASTAVPIFFMCSGFFIFNKIENLYNSKKIWEYLVKIIKLYLIWILIYMPFTIYEFVNDNNPLGKDILEFVRRLFFTGGRYYSPHLWYLLSLIYSLLFIGILLKYKVKIKIIYFISLLLFVFGSVMTIWIKNIDVLNHYVQNAMKYYSYIFANGSLFIGMFYVLTGIIISKYKHDISILLSIGFMMFFGNVFIQELYSPISVAVCAIIIFLLFVSIQFDDNAIYKKLREASSILYFMHMIFWSIYTIIIKEPFHSGFDSFIVTLISCILISIILIKLKNRKTFKWIKYIM
jgi:surface polysaccharide O-acyltransferase-like enzyme